MKNKEKEGNNHLDTLNHNNDKVTTITNPSNRIPNTKTRQKTILKKPKILYTSRLRFQNKYDLHGTIPNMNNACKMKQQKHHKNNLQLFELQQTRNNITIYKSSNFTG